MTQTFDAVLDSYLKTIAENGSATPRALKPSAEVDIEELKSLRDVTPFDDLATYFARVDGLDDDVMEEFDLFEPELAWGMSALSIKDSISHYQDVAYCGGSENPDYWPYGFLPIMQDGCGSYLVVNCIASSPAYGAVYDMCDGVGCNRLANSLREFFAASAQEVATGLRKYDSDTSAITVDAGGYLKQAGEIFGNSAYFARVGRMGSQIVDWK
ncbi:SMI1/KNR4 family protein [Pseudoduganella violaceinigra]|uniref:SMI1/KNR4 family protein n=1 Tax=Pseudoduganella violaceinigra TaxID=246602 RepID=UPI0003FDEF6A|nr:SMI1/KNR4 family protein [Pseudoduganella violaceinigra]